MPYSNVPESLWSKMDRCVEEVMKKGSASDKSSAIAICHSSIMKGLPEDEEMSRQDRARAKARRNAQGQLVIKDLSDLSLALSAEEAAAMPVAAVTQPISVAWDDLAGPPRGVKLPAVETKAEYPWEQCIRDNEKRYGSKKQAEEVCGAIRAHSAGKEWHGTEAEYAVIEKELGIVRAVETPAAHAPNGFTPEQIAQISVAVKALLDQQQAEQKALITQAELDAKAAALVAETGKSVEELLAEVVAEQEAAAKENPNRHPVSGQFITQADGKSVRAHDEPFATRVMPDATGAPRKRKWPSFLTQLKARLGLVPRVQPLRVFKDATGKQRWVMVATNNRRDRDNPSQILTEAAHKEFVAYLDAHPDKAPEAWLWHTPGSAWGKADWWDYSDGFMVYSGTVYAGKEAVAENLAKLKANDVGVSHGMYVLGYEPTQGLIHQYRTFELSPLPATRAANEWTSYHAIAKEVATLFNEQKRKFLVDMIGEDQVKALEAGTAGAKEVLDAIGVESKEASVVPPEEAAPETVAPAAEVLEAEKAIPPQFLKKPAAGGAAKPPAPKAAPAAAAKPAQAPAAAVAPAAAPAVPPHAHGADGTVAAVETPAEQAADTSAEGPQEDVGDTMQNDAENAQTADETQQAVMALADRVNMLTDKMDAMMGMMQSQGKEIGALKATDDEKLSWLIRPRVGPQLAKEGYRASVAPETKLKATIDDETLKSVEPSQTAQWFASEVLGAVGKQ